MPHGSKALRRFNHLLSETAEAYHDASVRLGLSYSMMAVEDGVFASWRPEDVETYLTLTERYLTAFREGIQNLEPEQEHQEEP